MDPLDALRQTREVTAQSSPNNNARRKEHLEESDGEGDPLPDDAQKSAPVRPFIGDEPVSQPPPLYLKKKQLGAGGYGKVWLCEKFDTRETCVAKIMDLPHMSGKEKRYALSEVECLGAVKHPNIISFIDSRVIENDNLVLVMELADAGDLGQQIKKRAAKQQYFRDFEIMGMFLQVAMAVRHIHEKNMMHRDIKSGNVLITANGIIKLADFGFSRLYEDTISQAVGKTFCGTPYYLAPELWKNHRYSSKADMWSLGVVLYELACLQRPFSDSAIQVLMEKIVAGRYEPVPPRYPPELHQLIARLLDLNPATRLSSSELFQQPYCQQSLRLLDSMIMGDAAIPEQQRQAIQAEIRSSLALTQTSPPKPPGNALQSPQATNVAVAHEGLLKKLSARQWKPKYLILRGGQLLLYESKEEVGAKEPRILPVDELQSVVAIRENIAHTKNVFALHTSQAKCTWFQAGTPEEVEVWLARIQKAMNVIP